MKTIDSAFSPHANGLNLLRLLLAISVIFWHSWAVLGMSFGDSPVRPLLAQAGVDGFFALSGFLIYRSWDRTPKPKDYTAARVLRILPGYYVCIIVSVIAFAPIGAVLQGRNPLEIYTEPESYGYIWKNLLLWQAQTDIAGSPSQVPYPGSWNASLWTLVWESMCYAAILILGLMGALKRRQTSVILMIISTAASIAIAADSISLPDHIGHIARFSTMFSAGMVMYAYRKSIPVHPLASLAAIALICASLALPNYRILAALPLSYLLISTGALLKDRVFWMRTDLSYGMYIYAFPIQQLLVMAGWGRLPVWIFAISACAITAAIAYASWKLVESPALGIKRRFRAITPHGTAVSN